MERNEFELLLLFIFNETAAQKANQKHTKPRTICIFRECEMKKCVCLLCCDGLFPRKKDQLILRLALKHIS